MAGYWQNLESRNWSNGGNVNFPMDGLPPQTRLRTIIVQMDLTGTKSAADALDGDLFSRWVQNVKLGNFVNIPGPELARLNWLVNGHVVEDPSATSIPGTGTSFTARLTFEVPLRDPRQPSSDDGSLPSELLASRGLELTLAPGTVHNVGSLIVNSGIIRCCIERVHETNVPQLSRIGYVDAPSQTIRLEAGMYKDLFVTKQDGSLLTQADINAVDLIADGRPILQNMRFDQLISAWNRTGYRNGAGTNKGELNRNGAYMLPLVWHDNSGKSNLTKQVLAEKDLLLQLNGGSLANPRLTFWKAVAKDTNTIQQVAAAIGAPADATTYEPATTSKTPPHGVGDGAAPKKKTTAQYAYLPGKFRRTPSPGNKLKG